MICMALGEQRRSELQMSKWRFYPQQILQPLFHPTRRSRPYSVTCYQSCVSLFEVPTAIILFFGWIVLLLLLLLLLLLSLISSVFRRPDHVCSPSHF